MSFLFQNIKKLGYLYLIFFVISCKGPEELDLTNIENQIINFNEYSIEDVNFPTINITTDGKDIVDEPKINASLLVIEDNNQNNYNIGIELRGSSSQMFPKKSYGFETKNSDYSDEIDINLGGFPEEEDWILYGPYSDKSLIRNKLTFDLSNLIGYKASNTKFYDLYINNDYKGLYILMEKIKRDKNRVDIPKINDNSVEGGYILKIDKPTGESSPSGGSCNTCYDSSFSFKSKYNSNGQLSQNSKIHFIFHYPKPKDITDNQKQYIQNFIDQFEFVLSSNNFDNNLIPEYISLIDIDSFIDFFIMNEITKNIDGYRLSTFIYLDEDKKLNMGPIWDFNLAFGNVDYCDGANTQGWLYNFNNICPGDVWQVPFWWSTLMDSQYFKEKLKTRWDFLRQDLFSNMSINNKINSYVIDLNSNDVINQNFKIWPIIGEYIWPNYYVGNSYESEIDFMKNWIDMRLTWLDAEIGKL